MGYFITKKKKKRQRKTVNMKFRYSNNNRGKQGEKNSAYGLTFPKQHKKEKWYTSIFEIFKTL